jgi:hypothetical protein
MGEVKTTDETGSPEDGRSMFLHNTCKYLLVHTASLQRRVILTLFIQIQISVIEWPTATSNCSQNKTPLTQILES